MKIILQWAMEKRCPEKYVIKKITNNENLLPDLKKTPKTIQHMRAEGKSENFWIASAEKKRLATKNSQGDKNFALGVKVGQFNWNHDEKSCPFHMV